MISKAINLNRSKVGRTVADKLCCFANCGSFIHAVSFIWCWRFSDSEVAKLFFENVDLKLDV